MNSSPVSRDGVVGLVAEAFTWLMTQMDEQTAVVEVSSRRRRRFPSVEPSSVDQLVQQLSHQYDGTPIRDFIPVLVEREARDRLSARTHRARDRS